MLSSLFFALFADGVARGFGEVAVAHSTLAGITGVAWLVHAYIVQARVGHVKNFFGNRVSPYVYTT